MRGRHPRDALPQHVAAPLRAQARLPARGEGGAAGGPQAFTEAAVVAGGPVLVVAQRERAGHHGGDARGAGTQAVVGVLEITVEGRVQRADAIEAVAPQVGDREGDALHAAGARVLADVALEQPRFGLLAPQLVRFDEAAGVVQARFRFRSALAAADDAVFRRGVGRIAQAPEPVGPGEDEVVVEQHEVVVRTRRRDAGVHAPHEAEVARQREQAHAPGIAREPLRRFVLAAVVHHDDLGRGEVAGQQGIQATLRQRPLVPREHDQRGTAHDQPAGAVAPGQASASAVSMSSWAKLP